MRIYLPSPIHLFSHGSGLDAKEMKKMTEEAPFIPALIVVDMQEDFCPPV